MITNFFLTIQNFFFHTRNKLKYISFKPIVGVDLKSVYDERNRRIALTFISSLVSKIFNFSLVIISVRLTANYLGVERYGFFMTLMSVLTIMSFADLGLGLGLQNCIAENVSNNTVEKLKENISSSFISLFFFSFFILIVFLIVNPFIKWEFLFNLKDYLAKSEANTSILVLFVCFVITIPLSIVQKIRNGFLEGYYNALWQFVGNIISFVLLLVFIHNEKGLPYLLFAGYSTTLFGFIFNCVHFFFFHKPELLPKVKFFSINRAVKMLKVGSIFFLLQILALIGTSADSVIIAHYLGASFVAMYAIGFRLQQILIIPVQIYLEPFWPAYNDAIHRNELTWIRSAFKKNFLFVTIVSIILGCFMVICGKQIIHIWIGNIIQLSTPLLLAFASYLVYANITGVYCTLLNIGAFLKYQLVILGITNLISIAVKVFFVNQLNVTGIVWITFLSYLVFYFVPATILIKKKIYYN